MEWRIAADIAVGIGITVAALGLYALKKISTREFLCFLLGTAIGTLFEFAAYFLGSDFLSIKMKWPLPIPSYFFCHSIWDGGIFMAGFILIRLFLRKSRADICRSFDWRELAILTLWGAGSAFVVELTGNGIMWEYHPSAFNPVWITIGKQSYTVFIQLTWLVVPAIFYIFCLAVSRKFEG